MEKRTKPAASTIQLSIADQAALLRDELPRAANDLAREVWAMNSIRKVQEKPDEFAPDLVKQRVFYHQRAEICEHYRVELMRLAARVFLELPEVARNLKYIQRVIPHWHADEKFDWEPVRQELREIEVAAVLAAAAGATARRAEPLQPKTYISGWNAILKRLGQKYSEAAKNLVARYNADYSGPIVTPRVGGRPEVEESALLEWWNSIYLRFEELKNQREGAARDAAASHNYGRTGSVAPAIAGEVKHRRRSGKNRPTQS